MNITPKQVIELVKNAIEDKGNHIRACDTFSFLREYYFLIHGKTELYDESHKEQLSELKTVTKTLSDILPEDYKKARGLK